jgi:hypothetical protein
MSNIKVTLDGRLVIDEALNNWIHNGVAAMTELKTAVDMDRHRALLEFVQSDAGEPLRRLLNATPAQQRAVADVLNVPDEEGFVSDGLTVSKAEGEDEAHWGCVYLQQGPVKIEVDVKELVLALRPFDVD